MLLLKFFTASACSLATMALFIQSCQVRKSKTTAPPVMSTSPKMPSAVFNLLEGEPCTVLRALASRGAFARTGFGLFAGNSGCGSWGLPWATGSGATSESGAFSLLVFLAFLWDNDFCDHSLTQ